MKKFRVRNILVKGQEWWVVETTVFSIFGVDFWNPMRARFDIHQTGFDFRPYDVLKHNQWSTYRSRMCWTLEEAKRLCLDEEGDEKLKVDERSKQRELERQAAKNFTKKILNPPKFESK